MFEDVRDLYDKCFEWFIANFANGQHGSLQIMAETLDGELEGMKILERSDEAMYRSCCGMLAECSAKRFVGLGEGQLMGKDGPINVFIMYFQGPSDETVQTAVMPYKRREDGAFLGSKWQGTDWMEESWLPSVG